MKVEDFLSSNIDVAGYWVRGHEGHMVKYSDLYFMTGLEIGQEIVDLRERAVKCIEAADKLSELLENARKDIEAGEVVKDAESF